MSEQPITVRFRRTGGYAGNLPALEIDTATIAAAEREEIARLARAVDFTTGEAQLARPVADAFQYELEVTTGSDRRRLILGDCHVPDNLRPLVERLTALARERRSGER